MYSQKMRLLSLNLVLVMLLTMVPVQAASIIIGDDGPLYTVALNGNGGTYGDDETLTISYGYSALYLEDYAFTREGYTLLGWSENEDARTLDYTRFDTLYASNVGEDRQTLYAVWGEGANCALYCDEPVDIESHQVGKYYVADSETLPAVSDSNFVAWYDHVNGVYYAEDTVCAGEVYRPIYSNLGSNVYPIILNGNGGKNERGNELVFCGATNDGFGWSLDSCFKKENYILNGWANSPESDVLVDVNYHSVTFTDFTPVDGVVMLYAHWSPAYQLKDSAELVINGDTMNELLSMSSSSTGTGWRFTPGNYLDVYNRYGLSEHYSFGSIACNDGIALHFDGDVSSGAIESGGMLCIWGNENTSLQISTHDTPAIQTSHLGLLSEDMIYYLQTDEGVCVNASCICLSSPNITIVGNPAVHPDAQIISHNRGIGYTISDDGTTLTTYAIDQNVTLDGNGGTFEGEKTIRCDYSVSDELDLSHYAFAREGYVLIGWAADADGNNFVSESNNTSYSQTGYQTLYAVWLKVPEDAGYAIFRFWGHNGERTIPDAFSNYTSSMTYCCMAITDDFIMPETFSDNDQYPVAWGDMVNHSCYISGERVTPITGTVFNADASIHEKGAHTIILDGNGGTCVVGYENGDYPTSRVVGFGSCSVGKTINYACNFTRPGYTLVSYNSKPDGSGTEYALNRCTVTADMDPIQILYAQWEKIEESGLYITIDGQKYDAMQDWSGAGWVYRHYENNYNELTLDGYNGGGIETDSDMPLKLGYEGKNCIEGNVTAQNLEVRSFGYEDNAYHTLAICADNWAALVAKDNLQIGIHGYSKLFVAGKGNVAVSAGNTLKLWLEGNALFSALGDNATAISAASIINGGGRDYLITAGTNSGDAVEVDAYSDQQYVSYEVRTKTLTLHGSGGKAGGKDNISIDTKESYVDLSQYRNSFSNDGKVLLGWSRNADAAGIDYANDSNVGFDFDNGVSSADLYAVWESDSQKGIALNGYGRVDGNDSEYYSSYDYYEYFTDAVSAGTTYTLPDSYKAGYAFKGWSDGAATHSAGEQISVDASKSFTAVYEVLSLTIDGKTYRMDKACGSSGIGWKYEPAYRYGYWDNQVELTVYENYSGKPINIPSNAYISLYGDVNGEDEGSAISVDGNARICSGTSDDGQKTVTITGGAGAPAVQVSGKLTIWSNCEHDAVFQGGNSKPALEAEGISVRPVLMLAGSWESDAVLSSAYNNESYVRIGDDLLTVTLKDGETVPTMPDVGESLFIAWRWKEDEVWYRPGDVIEGNERTLIAKYSDLGGGAVILDSNGGSMDNGSKYFVVHSTVSSPANLSMIKNTVLSSMHKKGYTLREFNDNVDGNGTGYSVEELFDNPGWMAVVGEIKTFFAQWTKTGDPEPAPPDEPEKTPDGSASYTVSDSTVTIKDVDMDKLLTESGGENSATLDLSETGAIVKEVSLPIEVVQEVSARGADDLTIRLPGASVSFDEKALSAVAAQSEGENLSLNINIGGRESLTGAQHEAVAKAKDLSVIEVSLSSDGKKISDFSGGNVTIDIPFEWSMQGLLCAYYIDDNGNKTAIDVTYKNGTATLVLKHFSTYVVELLDAPDDAAMILAANSVTVKTTGKGADWCIAAIYAADRKLLTVGVSPITAGEDFTTVAYSAENLSEQHLLKVFFLDESYQPASETLSLSLKE